MCLQLQSTYNSTIDINQPVLFDKYILNLNNDIVYNDGSFNVTSSGTYYISWWVSVSSPLCNINLSFKIRSCKGHNIEGCSSTNSNQIFGDAIVHVKDSHLKFSLVNSSNSNILLSTMSNIKANISIYKIYPTLYYYNPDYTYKHVKCINPHY